MGLQQFRVGNGDRDLLVLSLLEEVLNHDFPLILNERRTQPTLSHTCHASAGTRGPDPSGTEHPWSDPCGHCIWGPVPRFILASRGTNPYNNGARQHPPATLLSQTKCPAQGRRKTCAERRLKPRCCTYMCGSSNATLNASKR